MTTFLSVPQMAGFLGGLAALSYFTSTDKKKINFTMSLPITRSAAYDLYRENHVITLHPYFNNVSTKVKSQTFLDEDITINYPISTLSTTIPLTLNCVTTVPVNGVQRQVEQNIRGMLGLHIIIHTTFEDAANNNNNSFTTTSTTTATSSTIMQLQSNNSSTKMATTTSSNMDETKVTQRIFIYAPKAIMQHALPLISQTQREWMNHIADTLESKRPL